MKVAMALAASALILISQVSACTLAVGYFYQVTALRGRVVGMESHFAYIPRWLRQSHPKRNAQLELHEYGKPWDQTSLVKIVESDDHGNFDFGPLEIGHYALRIQDNDIFDVEIKALPRVTESVIIDVSPIHPDCTGGHEFIVRSK